MSKPGRRVVQSAQPVSSVVSNITKDEPGRPVAVVVAYYRVSTVRQERSGLGLEAQHAAVLSQAL